MQHWEHGGPHIGAREGTCSPEKLTSNFVYLLLFGFLTNFFALNIHTKFNRGPVLPPLAKMFAGVPDWGQYRNANDAKEDSSLVFVMVIIITIYGCCNINFWNYMLEKKKRTLPGAQCDWCMLQAACINALSSRQHASIALSSRQRSFLFL